MAVGSFPSQLYLTIVADSSNRPVEYQFELSFVQLTDAEILEKEKSDQNSGTPDEESGDGDGEKVIYKYVRVRKENSGEEDEGSSNSEMALMIGIIICVSAVILVALIGAMLVYRKR